MPDRVDRLREAAQARHEATLRRATTALQRLARRGEPVTFRRVAETAGVSRSWLYRQPQLRDEITRLRDATAGRPGTLPAAERATADSLRQQVRTYRDEVTRLRTENQELRDQLARHLGAARATAVTKGP
jgi:DNA anti-recombination protein RmuC